MPDKFLLTDEDIVCEICAMCDSEAKYMNDDTCRACLKNIKLSSQSQRALTLKEIGA